jgi:hypothetical protein
MGLNVCHRSNRYALNFPPPAFLTRLMAMSVSKISVTSAVWARANCAARSAGNADVKFKGGCAVALVARLRHVEEIAQFAKELLADRLFRRGCAFPVRNKFSRIPFRHGAKHNHARRK